MDAEQLDDLGSTILDAAFDIHSRVGNGLREHHYHQFMQHALAQRGLRVDREVRFDVTFEGLRIPGALRCDLVVEGLIAVELKARENALVFCGPQVLAYVLHGALPLGYLINFREPRLKNGVRRFVNQRALRCS